MTADADAVRWAPKKLEALAGTLYRFANTFQAPDIREAAEFIRREYERQREHGDLYAAVTQLTAELATKRAQLAQIERDLAREAHLESELAAERSRTAALATQLDAERARLREEREQRARERIWLDLADQLLHKLRPLVPANEWRLVEAIHLSGVPARWGQRIRLLEQLGRLAADRLTALDAVLADGETRALVQRLQATLEDRTWS